MIPGTLKEFSSARTLQEADENELWYPIDFLNSIPGTVSLLDHHISLDPRFMVMVLRTLQTMDVHVNLTRKFLESMGDNSLYFCITTAHNEGR